MIYQYNYPTRIQFGSGAVKLLPDALEVAGRKRPLVVTDKGLAPLPPVTGTVKLLEEAGLAAAVFSGIWGNPVKSPVTAATGMDALTHLVESYLSKGFHPMCDGIALEGLRLVSRNLEVCVGYAKRIAGGEKALLEDEAHREARGMMLNAAMMGGVAF